MTISASSQPAADGAQPLRGRSLFVVETTAAGVAVQTAFLSDDNRVFSMPAVFPDVSYALAQVDELRQQVLQHFSRAAQVGAQVLAAQAQAKDMDPSGATNEGNAPVATGGDTSE